MKKLSPNSLVAAACMLLAATAAAQPAFGWFFGPATATPPVAVPAPEPNQAEPAQVEDGKQQSAAEDDLLLLSDDDEVFHNKKVLKSLNKANPKEVEELIDNNPILEELVLKKIQARLEKESRFPVKELEPKKKKVYGYPGVVHRPHQSHTHHHHHHHHNQQTDHEQQQQEYLEDLDEDLGDLDMDEQVVDKKKYDSLKEKLKSNAAKIFKMGTGFKQKYAALRNKYKVKGVTKETPEVASESAAGKMKVAESSKDKDKHKKPKFYIDVSH